MFAEPIFKDDFCIGSSFSSQPQSTSCAMGYKSGPTVPLAHEWIIDTGCGTSIGPSTDLKGVRRPTKVSIGNLTNTNLKADFITDVQLQGNRAACLAADTKHKLWSISQDCDEGKIGIFMKHGVYVLHPDRSALADLIRKSTVTLQGRRCGPLWTASPEIPPSPIALVVKSQATDPLVQAADEVQQAAGSPEELKTSKKRYATDREKWMWHLRYSHLNFQTLSQVFKSDDSPDKSILISPAPLDCRFCLLYKSRRVPRKLFATSDASYAGEVIAGDIHDFVYSSWGGYRYLLLFVDVHSRKDFPYYLRSKDEAAARYKSFMRRLRSKTGRWPIVSFTDEENVLNSRHSGC
jgi:hypothetical protein